MPPASGIKYFPNHFDKLLPMPQGNIRIRNLRLSSDNPSARLILALGGLQNVSIENLVSRREDGRMGQPTERPRPLHRVHVQRDELARNRANRTGCAEVKVIEPVLPAVP
jgi:hypothetical protein